MKEADKYQKTIITDEAEYILTECKTGVLLTKMIDNKTDSELFCENAELSQFECCKDIEKQYWTILTEKEKAQLEPWHNVKKQAPTIQEPHCMNDIRRYNKALIKCYLYSFDYICWRINQHSQDSHSLKAQRFDKDLIHAGTSDSTALRAEKNLDNTYQKERRRIAKAILDVYNYLATTDPKKADFMEKAYSCNDEGKKQYIEKDLMQVFNISETTVLNWKRWIIQKVAYNLGMELPIETEGENE